jgi:hypothetical protein
MPARKECCDKFRATANWSGRGVSRGIVCLKSGTLGVGSRSATDVLNVAETNNASLGHCSINLSSIKCRNFEVRVVTWKGGIIAIGSERVDDESKEE